MKKANLDGPDLQDRKIKRQRNYEHAGVNTK